MARCPNCNENWFWDWCQDTYKYFDGSEVEPILFMGPNGEDSEVIVFRCKCGSINSTMVVNSLGVIVHCVEKWCSINWEWDGHSWDNNCLNCKDQDCLTT